MLLLIYARTRAKVVGLVCPSTVLLNSRPGFALGYSGEDGEQHHGFHWHYLDANKLCLHHSLGLKLLHVVGHL